MAKIKVVGTAVVIETTMKLEEIKKVLKYKPEALKVFDENEEIDFMVKVAEEGSAGSLNDYVAAFASTTTNADGRAQITLAMNVWEPGDLKEVIADEFGVALVKLGEIEKNFGTVVAQVTAEREAILENITIG